MPARACAVATVLLCCGCAPLGVQDGATDQDQDEIQQLAETYAFEVDQIFEALLKQVSAADRNKLSGAERVYSNDETAFAFYVLPGSSQAIHLTAGGLTSLTLSAEAAAIARHLLDDDDWWFDYLLAERAHVREAQRAGDSGLKLWASPQHVLGCDWPPQSGALQEQGLRTEYVLRMNMLAFVVAHEAGHVVLEHDPARLSSETPAEHDIRLRANELAADNWALPVLVRMRVNPYDVVRALFTHLVIFGSNDNKGRVHQDDVARIKLAQQVYQREFPWDYAEFNASVAKLLDVASPAGSASIFDHLDAKAKQTSFSALHHTKRTTPIPNANEVCQTNEVIPAWIRELSREIYHPEETDSSRRK